jgi:hypothetical protein
MKLRDIISELSFAGRPCTKDCSGHQAGYRYAIQTGNTGPSSPYSPSFNSGQEVAADKMAGKTRNPKVRTPAGKFAAKPKLR